MPQTAEAAASAEPPTVTTVTVPQWVNEADRRGYAWVRQNWQRAAAVPGAWFDEAKADAAVTLFPRYFKLTILQFAGAPFVPEFDQECIIRLFFGWKRPEEVTDVRSREKRTVYVRVYRELRLWVPRKWGKTEFIAALALLAWYYEGLPGGEGYCFARDEKQAAVPFARMKAMIGASLDDMRRSIRSFAEKLWCQQLEAPFFLITAKAEGKHGRVPYVTVGDEMHEWRSRDLADNLRQGSGPLLQPVRLYASTAGLKSQVTGRELFEESQQLLDGRLDDPTVLVVMFSAGDDDDWTDEKVWERVNPHVGVSPTWSFLREEFKKAKASRAAEAKFRCYHLNQWVEDYQRWLPIAKWDACCSSKTAWKTFLEKMKGRTCHVAFDSTFVNDFAAMCFRFAPLDDEPKPVFAWLCWLPQDTIDRRVQAERQPFDQWTADGAIIAVPGGTFQLPWAIKAAREAVQRFDVQKIGWDSWAAKEFYNALTNPPAGDDAAALPEDLFVEMRFGTKTLGEASKSFERRVLEGDLDHGGHPVARWMAGHCHVRFDENMNYVPAKKRSEKSIDLIQTGVMTEALSLPPPEMGLGEMIEKGLVL